MRFIYTNRTDSASIFSSLLLLTFECVINMPAVSFETFDDDYEYASTPASCSPSPASVQSDHECKLGYDEDQRRLSTSMRRSKSEGSSVEDDEQTVETSLNSYQNKHNTKEFLTDNLHSHDTIQRKKTKLDNQYEFVNHPNDCNFELESIHNHPHASKATCYEEICNEQLQPYQWPTLIPTAFQYHAVQSTFFKEIASNPFLALTFSINALCGLYKECCILHKSKGHKVQTKTSGKYEETTWYAGETITKAEMFAVKMYTDWDLAQKQLKLCYRPPRKANSAEYLHFQKRLCHFRHWRQTLDLTILKFGEPMGGRVFYHGVDQLMKLEMHPTHQFCGPLSVSVDKQVARSFTGNNGFIMTLCSRYPRLNSDYGLEVASIISDYPEEKEYVIRSLYTRILHIEFGIPKSVHQLVNNTNDTLYKLLCFVISSLMANNLYSFDIDLERVFKALLIRTDEYRSEQDQQLLFDADDEKETSVVQDIAAAIPQRFVEEFNARRRNHSCLKLDAISHGVRSLFFKDGRISLQRILKFMPNLVELQLLENYEISNAFIAESTLFLQRTSSIYEQFECIKFMKFSFAGSPEQFQLNRDVSESSTYAWQSMGWSFTERHHSLYYKCIISRSTL
mmetsp:Transcript_53536/g.88789  ORF Transcript_53536/g.88789 Transcript_53536/m.88789 type:complete len:623 (+) Transcript_53536:469-2337(+)